MQINPEVMRSNQLKIKAAKISLFASFLVIALKITGYKVSGSTAIFSDALETLINILTAATALWVIKYVAQPKDENHPYGHGKAEFFSAAFEGGLILFAAITIMIESYRSFVAESKITDLNQGIFFVVIASLVNLAVSLYLRKIGKNEKSETLLASSSHIMSDVITTSGVVVGLILVKVTELFWLDPLLSFIISFHLVVEGIKIIRRSISGLTDELDDHSLNELSYAIQKNLQPGIINIHNLRSIRSGNFHHIDAHLIVPEFWNVALTHKITHEFEKNVVMDYPYDGEFAFHLDPCKADYCRFCNIEMCPIRVSDFQSLSDFSAKEMIKGVN
ncbi:MAG: cation transporter [Deltaproteobacteria bacterium]|jgi:cation diffusion facilitator family transporter|nr:cation transporter [Deltaproteobacteria bacterium]